MPIDYYRKDDRRPSGAGEARVFDGKTFYLSCGFYDESDARKYAERCVRKGKQAKITSGEKGYSNFVVWLRS